MRLILTSQTFGLLATLSLSALPTMASAHAGNDDPNVVHVCIGNVSKVVRSVGVSGACIAGPPLVAETADHWPKSAIQGLKGDKGDKGDTGAAGAPGVNGTNGLDGASVTFGGYFTGNQNGCPNGGAIYAAGNPSVQTYVCNGSNGADGTGGTRADGPCFDDVNRYVDCGNGTVTDSVTRLIWLKQADCLPADSWAAANQAAAALKNGDCGLTDKSSTGDWRLPTQEEWSAMMVHKLSGAGGVCVPAVVNDAWTGCFGDGTSSSFVGVTAGVYWSATTLFFLPTSTGLLIPASVAADLATATTSGTPRTFSHLVWPVRGGR